MSRKPHEHCDTKKSATQVIWLVGGLGYISLIGFIVLLTLLIAKNKPIPPELLVLLTGLGGTGVAASVITGLLSLLGRTGQDSPSGTASNPMQTEIVNTPANPGQVEIAKP